MKSAAAQKQQNDATAMTLQGFDNLIILPVDLEANLPAAPEIQDHQRRQADQG